LDEVEPSRSPAPARAEPQGDLALLLHGFEEIQQRNTDRILAALRQTGGSDSSASRTQNSAERVGVFVDVPNLVYAARYLNRWIDFGRLLERLLNGRRLIRAHAYSPTDPDPSADQQFLTPVKAQGYRLTTKNYRTFASGAKKADMDLDLCMDVVRLVVAKAVECIVLCSGDGDFLPLLDFCADNGVRVEVASFVEATSDELRQACDASTTCRRWKASACRARWERQTHRRSFADQMVHGGIATFVLPTARGKRATRPVQRIRVSALCRYGRRRHVNNGVG